ncbi:hypothetical protein ATCC90586_000752 [Pythium insidiosum]|nr:hypothetical protein ATCC90586_000752 [Pythium insidiosum]
MGAALATNCLADTSIYDHLHLQQLELLSEYTLHSIKPLQECAQIFLGTSDAGYPEDELFLDAPTTRLSVAATTRSAPVAYPRQLSLSQFEDVFGMLVADVDPHFEFFEELSVGAGGSAADVSTPTVCAHYVFCSVALLVRAEIQVKIAFLLKLYADRHDQLSDERKRTLLRDFLIALHHTLSLTERVDNSVVSVLEKVFWSGDDPRSTSIREMYDMCFTNARVSGYLHAVQSITKEFASSRAATHVRPPVDASARGGNSEGDSLRFLHRSAFLMDLLYPPSSSSFPSPQELSSHHFFESKFEVFEETTINILECWFNVLLRFACGVESVAVLRGSTSSAAYRQARSDLSSVPQQNDTTLLGCLSLFDILKWLQQDMSLLNGKEKYAVGAFPAFSCTPILYKTTTSSASLLDAWREMRSRRLTGLLLIPNASDFAQARVLSSFTLRALAAAVADDEQIDPSNRLHILLEEAPQLFEPCHFVTTNHSIAHIIHIMCDHQARRVYILDEAKQDIVGIIRATDVLRLLLKEQHEHPRVRR